MAAVNVKARIASAPEFNVVREVDANDSVLPTDKASGVNCADFDELVVMCTLLNSATAATVELHFWSDAKNGSPNGGFVNEATPQTITVNAAGVIKRVFAHHHGSIFFGVTGITGGSGKRVRIEVAGVPVYGQKGV